MGIRVPCIAPMPIGKLAMREYPSMVSFVNLSSHGNFTVWGFKATVMPMIPHLLFYSFAYTVKVTDNGLKLPTDIKPGCHHDFQ